MVLPSDSQHVHETSAGLSHSDQQMSADLLKQSRDVGREFVYIYYMSLNECPQDLHRFYTTSSVFIHGGLERPENEQQPAVGQVEIANRINALHFQDCRTKILMVDSEPAPNNGVLIQVCGEISNNASPMRRFMQTFLLAPNGPKKYFVQNNIFRYQDEVFHESDAEDEILPAATSEPLSAGDMEHSGTVRHEDADYAVPSVDHPEPSSSFTDDNQIPVINGDGVNATGPPEEFSDVPAEPMLPESEVLPAPQEAEPVSTLPKSHEPQAKKTFATLFGSSGVTAPGTSPTKFRAPANRQAAPAHTTAPTETPAATPPTTNGHGNLGDSHQIFVGNLKKTVKEDDLVSFFTQFGSVVFARITQGKPKIGQSDVPNFGFVGFADPAGVQQVLSQKPILMNGERLNVEAKKGPIGFSGGRGGSRGGHNRGNFRGGRRQ